MPQQLVTVERSPLLLPRRHRLPPQEIRVDRAAFLQDLWRQKKPKNKKKQEMIDEQLALKILPMHTKNIV